MANQGNPKPLGKAFGVLFMVELKLQEISGLLSDADDNVKRKLQETIDFVSSVEPFALSKSTPTSSLLEYIIEETSKLDFDKLRSEGKMKAQIPNTYVLGMISDTGQVKILQFLIRKINAKSALEVGTYSGYGAFGMVEAMAPGGKVTGIDFEPYFCNFVNKTAKERDLNVECKEGPALTVLNSLAKEGQKYDFIYIDCVKEEYSEYFKIIMDNDMLHKDGIIACDNVIFGGQAIAKKNASGIALDEFSSMVVKDERVTSVMLPCYDGLLLIQHKN